MEDQHISLEEEQDISNRHEDVPDPKLETHGPKLVNKERKATDMEYVCDHCNKSFGKKSNLQRHLRTSACQRSNQHHCPTCTSSFGQKQQLINHIKKEHQNRTSQLLGELKCTKCGQEFSKKSNLDKHTRNDACQQQKTELKCPKCEKEFQTKSNLDRHIKSGTCEKEVVRQQQKTVFKCSKCEQQFKKKSNLDRHIKSGTCEKEVVRHHCSICQASFSNKRNLEKHILKDHPAKAADLLENLTCGTCGKTFPQKEHLELHKEKGYCDKTEERHACPECGKTYKYRKRMLKHMRDFHPEKSTPIKPHRLEDVEGYHCCGESFANGREYRTHKDRVHIRKPVDITTKRMTTFICKECQQQFERKSDLIKHREDLHPPEDMSSDDDELPNRFKCPYSGCQECFQSRTELTRHKDEHRKPKERIQNNGTFESATELTDHRKTHHQPKEIICDQCDEQFENEEEMKIHLMDEHDPNDEPGSQETLINDLDVLLDKSSAKSLYTKIGVDIVDKAGQKMFKSLRTRQSFRLTPKALRLCEVGLALEVMNKIIGSLVKKIVEKGGSIQIKVLSDSLDMPIVMPFIKVEFFDPLVLLNYIEKVLSSKDAMALDQSLTFDIIHVEDVQGSGRLNTLSLDSFIQRRTGIFDPKNWDKRCLGLCLAAWELISRLTSQGEDLQTAAFFKDPNKSHELKLIARRLYEEAGVDQEKQCGDNELRRFQHLFNDRHGKQIIVLNEEHVEVFTGEPKRQREEDQVFLLWFEKHYFLIWDLEAFLGKRIRFCHRCLNVYKSSQRHLCRDTCQQCERVDCEALENHETIIVCEQCNITFRHRNCYVAHSNKTQRVCLAKRYRCQDCLCIRYTDQKHDCSKKAKCVHCKVETDLATHLCVVQKPSETTRLGGSDKFNVIYFDAETAKDEEGRLVPYLICYAINCEKCMNIKAEYCEQCGQRYRYHYGWNSAFEFCDWLISNKRIEKHRTILTAHNSAKFDAYFIYDYAAQVGARPKLQFRANDLLSLKWKRIQLKDSYQFMKCSLDKLPSILGLDDVQKGFFAYRLADREPDLNYHGQIPPPHDFMIEKMLEEKQREFYSWYNPLKNDPSFIYDLKAEALKYCYMDVKILEAAWKLFRTSCLKLTDAKVDPLLGQYFTLASFSAAIFKSLFMHDPIGIIPYGGYPNPKRTGQSWQGSAYLDYLNHQRESDGKTPLVCANNSPVEARFGNYKVDGYCRETSDVYEILGCYWHAHCSKPGDCMWGVRSAKHQTKKPLTYEEVNTETITRLKQLELHPDIRNVHSIWLCEITKEMKTNPILSAFMENDEMLKRYRNPLNPSEAVFGGRVECFKPRMILTEEQIMQGYTIEYVDFCSLYPFVQWAFSYTTNAHPTVIVDQTKLTGLLNGALTQLLSNNYGVCYCKVLPPQNLDFAVLPYRTRNKTVFPLCAECADQDTNDCCAHVVDKRALKGTYTFYELLKAIQRGYEVLQIYELWDYGPEKAKIFADYVSKMIKLKTQHSPVPAEMSAQEFCDLWNERVPGINIRPEDLSESPAMRQSAKILMNSLWGKFCERASKSETMLINKWQSLKTLLNDKEKTITRIEQLSGRSLVISYEQKEQFQTESSMYNPVLGAYVTAYARVTLLENCLEVVGDRALYCDTDSLVYLQIPGEPEPVKGEALGQLANELKKDEFINCFQCVAPKTWRAEVSIRTGQDPIAWQHKRTIVKSKGIYLNALGSSIKTSFDVRELWNDLIDMKLIEEDELVPRRSIKEFYDSLNGYQLPHDLWKPCLDAFMQQKWIKGRAHKKASGVFVPQPRLVRDRFSAKLKEELYSKKIIRFRHDKSMLLNSETNWPENINSTKPYGWL